MLFRGKYRVETTRLPGFDYSSPGSYFITLVTKWRARHLGVILGGKMELSEPGRIIVEEWLSTLLVRRNVTLDAFQVMPDHFHGIVMIHESETAADSGLIPFVDWDKSMIVLGINTVETDGRPSPQESKESQSPTPNKFGPPIDCTRIQICLHKTNPCNQQEFPMARAILGPNHSRPGRIGSNSILYR